MFTNKNNDTHHDVLSKELGSVIETALESIPLDYKMVFSLREINGMSTEETAETLDISESNVKVRLNRAKGMLRERIQKAYSPEEIFEFNLIYCDAMVERVMNLI
jgi:RNA polymerase sigma-70 factor (ECF subfamily)